MEHSVGFVSPANACAGNVHHGLAGSGLRSGRSWISGRLGPMSTNAFTASASLGTGDVLPLGTETVDPELHHSSEAGLSSRAPPDVRCRVRRCACVSCQFLVRCAVDDGTGTHEGAGVLAVAGIGHEQAPRVREAGELDQTGSP
jgi:hypothetical protein